jgi:hypothetical protein
MSKTSNTRRRRNDRSEIPVSFLPEGNPAARWAYLLVLIGLLPGPGVACGPAAAILGTIGRRVALSDEERRGLGHAYVSRVLGSIEFICGIAGFICLAKAIGWF